MYDHRSSGRIVYDPHRGDMKHRTMGWCVVDVDKEITRYFRWWMRYEKHIHLAPPSWDAHISVVRGERLLPSVQEHWKQFDGQVVQFDYHHVDQFRTDPDIDDKGEFKGLYYYVDLKCQTLNNIRSQLKLPVGWQFHITFGRTYEYQARKPKLRK